MNEIVFLVQRRLPKGATRPGPSGSAIFTEADVGGRRLHEPVRDAVRVPLRGSGPPA